MTWELLGWDVRSLVLTSGAASGAPTTRSATTADLRVGAALRSATCPALKRCFYTRVHPRLFPERWKRSSPE